MKTLGKYLLISFLILIGSMAGGALVSPLPAQAGTITSFSSNDTLSPTALNANFAHLHASVGHGHGGVIVDADVNSGAAISMSKLASPALIPKAWAYVAANCGGTPCNETLSASAGIVSISHTGVGTWAVTAWTISPRADVNYGIIVMPMNSFTPGRFCSGSVPSTTQVAFSCFTSSAVASDTAFMLVMFDNT